MGFDKSSGRAYDAKHFPLEDAMSSNNPRYLSVSALLPLLSGCSVAMALSGTPEPNFEAFEVGSSRKQVEIQLGSPIASQQLDGGKKEDTSLLSKLGFEVEPSWVMIGVNGTTQFTRPPRRLNHEQGV